MIRFSHLVVAWAAGFWGNFLANWMEAHSGYLPGYAFVGGSILDRAITAMWDALADLFIVTGGAGYLLAVPGFFLWVGQRLGLIPNLLEDRP